MTARGSFNRLWSIRVPGHYVYHWPGVSPIHALVGLCVAKALEEQMSAETWYKLHVVDCKRVIVTEEGK